jgi:hypothetical protein
MQETVSAYNPDCFTKAQSLNVSYVCVCVWGGGVCVYVQLTYFDSTDRFSWNSMNIVPSETTKYLYFSFPKYELR